MGFDRELTTILRDVVQFLECLREAKLPINLESIRDSLLIRSKDTLTMFMVEKIGRSTSPEQYLNMNAIRPKGLVAVSKTQAELEEYVGAEEHSAQKLQHDYYETFQSVEATNNITSDHPLNQDEEIERIVVEIYQTFPAAQTKIKCQKCGPLFKREGKKLFVFEQYRACWVGLVGLHLLIYESDHDNRPYKILPIRGYMARAAPNAISRDQRKSESTFEIFRPGNRTLQFVAKSPKDMEDWVMKISELYDEDKKDNKDLTKSPSTGVYVENDASQNDGRSPREESNSKEERYQNVETLGADKTIPEVSLTVASVPNGDGEAVAASPSSKDVFSEAANLSTSASPPEFVPAPRLPARIPRRLPSLPVRGSSTSYELPEEEEDDIYHKIEDFRDTGHCYGNVGKILEIKPDDNHSNELETYDDISANIKDEIRPDEKSKKNSELRELGVARRLFISQSEATYDDAASASIAPKDNARFDENLLLNGKSSKDRATENSEVPAKSPLKKSCLSRVRSKRESPRKSEKKLKRKIPTPPPTNIEETSTYDDVSDLMNAGQEAKRSLEEEESEYNCPPPPRPVYTKPPVIADEIDKQTFYDDIAVCRRSYKDEETCQSDRRISSKVNHIHGVARTDVDNFVSCGNIDYQQRSPQDNNEHYQTPRNESSHHKYPPVNQQEELYDDIAILIDLTVRQKELLGKKENEEATKTQAGSEKRPWNRFGNGKKSKFIDSIASERNCRVSNVTEEADDLGKQHSLLRMNTFQKLISKMENSLGKASIKATPSVSVNKTNVTNNA
ncbi:uncharacterized protein LOC143148012 [Ptiloglossa arizonensis]|uniref:uncharacterized protein LOC143148012 n=1 Tax=Ptiloglossa arizonensis TaxID=3350558 RepID=UPI003FA0CF37